MKYKLICFDVDGTLIDNVASAWQVFHDHFRTDPEVRKKAMELFYSKRMVYEDWARHDVDLWKRAGKTKGDFLEAMRGSGMALMPGALEALRSLKAHYPLAIISGSLSIVLEWLLPEYENIFSYIHISRLNFHKDGSIESIDPTCYDGEGKALALRMLARSIGCDLKECVFIGDNQNDLHVAQEAGLSIAFNAKSEELRRISKIQIDKKDMTAILPFILRQE